ncbi:MAG: hypothetical protein ACOCSL_05160 [Thermoplasmatota archaeon]
MEESSKTKLGFIIPASLSIFFSGLIVVMVAVGLISFRIYPTAYFSFLLVLSLVQVFRIHRRNIVYRNWVNSDAHYFGQLVPPLLSMPALIFLLGGSVRILSFGTLILIIVFVSYLTLKTVIERNSFFRKNISLSEVEGILEENGLKYETEKKQTLFGNNYKKIYLPMFSVSVFKIKKKTLVKPDNRKCKDNVYDIINFIESDMKNPFG